MRRKMMKPMGRTLLASIIGLSILFAGCGLLEFKDNMTTEDKARFVRSASTAATLIAFNEIYKDDAQRKRDKAYELKNSLESTVIPLLQDRTVSVDSTTEKLLMTKIPMEYQAYFNVAMMTLRMYYETPDVGELLDDDQWQIFISFFYGITDGLDLIIGP